MMQEGFCIFEINNIPKMQESLVYKKIECFYELDNKNKKNKKILDLQKKDIKKLYKKKLFDVLYVIPNTKIGSEYCFNFIVIVKNERKINLIEEINFEVIKIDLIRKIEMKEINFKILNMIFDINKEIIYKNVISFRKNQFYKKDNKINNFNKYVNDLFSLMCLQINSFDLIGENENELSEYGLDFIFATNFFDLSNAKNLDEEKKLEEENIYLTSLSDNLINTGISLNSFRKKD